MIVGYMRVSTEEQNLDRQEFTLKQHGVEKVFVDKLSGKDTEGRPEFKRMISFLREGDSLIVSSMDRLARSASDLIKTIEELIARKVRIKFLDEGITLDGEENPFTMLTVQIFASLAEFQRKIIKKTQREGIERAKEKGVYKGRKPKLVPWQVEKLKDMNRQGISKSEIGKYFGIPRVTVYNYL